MKSGVVLHIGTRKTGTSSIQEALAQAQECGRLGQAHYPMPDGDRDHVRLTNVYLPHTRIPRADRAAHPHDDERFAAAQRSYRESFFGNLGPAKSVIVSSETLATLSTEEAARLRADFRTAGFSDFHIVLYVRDPADYYLSHVQQVLKASSVVADPNTFRYEFRQIAMTWERVFPGQLTVRRHRSDTEYDVVQDFSDVLQGSLGVSLPPITSRLNTTISAEGMDVLQLYRSQFWSGQDDTFTPDTKRLVKFLHRSLSELPQTAPSLKPWIAQTVRFNHRDDTDFLATHYGVDLHLHDIAPAPQWTSHHAKLRVADVLQQIDPQVRNDLLRRIAKSGLDSDPHKRHWPDRIANRARRLTGRSTLGRLGSYSFN
jgi:hypothetical protein